MPVEVRLMAVEAANRSVKAMYHLEHYYYLCIGCVSESVLGTIGQ